MFFFDLDRFKLVNDSLGHAVGDEVLLAVAERLRATMPDVISLSRLHGDEFAALEPNVADTDAALQRAEELRTILSRPVQLSTGPHVVGDPEHRARAARRRRPRGVRRPPGRGHGHAPGQDREAAAAWRSSTPACARRSGNRLELEHDLRTAVDNGELRLEYQPLASLANGRVLGLEALVRWEHPRRGLLLPARFVALAEESELIVALGAVGPRGGLRPDGALARHVPRGRRLVPGRQRLAPPARQPAAACPPCATPSRRAACPAGALMLEITESGLVSDDGHLNGMLEELREFGVRLAIDDFGTGYSSLSYLKRLPVSYIKIDRSFVSGLGTDAEDERIVAAITELGHGLGLRVIAEGVENRQQRHVARQLGCDLYQGYLLAEPRRPRDIPAFWRPRPSAARAAS